ncbi:MAG: hypothetical protein ABIO57_00865 [Candidatus Paceibacterota bacterium]
MSFSKKSIIGIAVIGIIAFSLPQSVAAAVTTDCTTLTGTARTQCLNKAASPTLQKFNPNVKINSGNSYQGISISGVGGAIASCTNVGGFLANTASDFLSNTSFAKSIKSAFNNGGDSDPVSTTDEKTQAKIDSANRTTNCLNGIAYAVAKNTLAQVTNKTLNWVNTGLNGNPLYVQNSNSFLKTIANNQIKSYLADLPQSDSIFGNALESGIRQGITGRSDGLLNVYPDTPQAKAYTSFLGNFTNGGWDSFLNPQYNSIGALFTATDNLARKVASEQQSSKDEIQRNNGFLDMKHCVQYADNSFTSSSTAISGGLSTNPTCIQWQTDTPGSIIAAQVQAITTSPIRQLEYADKINEVLGGFFDSFVNSLLSKGLRGSGSQGSTVDFGFSSSGDNVVLDSNGNALNSTVSDTASLGYQASKGGNGIDQNFDISRPQQFRLILQTQYDFLVRTKDAQTAINRIIPNLGALDYCIPGPTPTWSAGAAANLEAMFGPLVQDDPTKTSTSHKIVESLPIIGSFLGTILGIGDHAGEAPPIWTTPGYLNDPVSGAAIQVPRVFYTTWAHADDDNAAKISAGYHNAFNLVTEQYSYWNTLQPFTDAVSPTPYSATPVEHAFLIAGQNDADKSYADGFLADTKINLYSILGYNKAASAIDAQYDTNIGQTENNIRQMLVIQKQINDIVGTAKAAYIKSRAAQGNPVDLQCINNAYVIDNSPIVPVAPQEQLDVQDPIEAHATESSNFFYKNIAI